jgi:predicted CoA-binding protein
VVPGLLEEAAAAGIRRIWLQQGSSSLVAVARGRELDLELVAGECLLLHLEPVKGIHAIHRWLRSLWRRA